MTAASHVIANKMFNHLPTQLAKDLFVKYYREEIPNFVELLDKLLAAIQYHTLLVELFAKNLKKARSLNFEAFLENLAADGLIMGVCNFKIETEYNNAKRKGVASTDEIIEILYDFSKISV